MTSKDTIIKVLKAALDPMRIYDVDGETELKLNPNTIRRVLGELKREGKAFGPKGYFSLKKKYKNKKGT